MSRAPGTPEILVNALSVIHGGGRSYAANLIRELERDSRGFRFTFLVPEGEFSDHGSDALRIRGVGLPPRPAPLRLLARVLYEELVVPFRARRFDLLYCVADIAPPISTAPCVVALRNLNIYDRRYYDTLRLRTLYWLARAGVPRATRLVFPTQAAAALIAERIPVRAEQVAVVPHGVSRKTFRSDSVASTPSVPYLLLPAALERHKNIELLIDSAPLLRDPRMEVWLAGPDWTDPSYVAELRARVARNGLRDRVRILGTVPYERMFEYYRGAAALVFPSFIETFGHPILEAMLAGTPIVAADIPAFREVARDAALYFPVDDPRALAQAVDRVVADPAEAALRVERGRSIAEEYSWKRSVDELCQVFASVLSNEASAVNPATK